MAEQQPPSAGLIEQLHADDIVVPFQLEGTPVRGRLVRLGATVDRVLSAHDYPESVSRVLGEALALTAMLGAALKFDGLFTLQAQGDGPLSMLVADYATEGALRGYASFDEAALSALGDNAALDDLCGDGSLALTIDPRLGRDRYQGIVPLEGETLADCAEGYFAQSEQIPTTVALAVARRFAPGVSAGTWIAGGLLLQYVPGEGGRGMEVDAAEEEWVRASLLADTVEDDELVDPTLSPDRLLYRLFHEDGVRVFAPKSVHFGCRCSRERLEGVLRSYPVSDLAEMAEGGAIKARCEFCNTVYVFALDDFEPPGGEDGAS